MAEPVGTDGMSPEAAVANTVVQAASGNPGVETPIDVPEPPPVQRMAELPSSSERTKHEECSYSADGDARHDEKITWSSTSTGSSTTAERFGEEGVPDHSG